MKEAITNNYQIPDLFSLGEIESKAVLKACNIAHQALGELKGVAQTMQNQNILLGTLPLQEAKESSEIENIITTEDDLYQSNASTSVIRYSCGERSPLLCTSHVIEFRFHLLQQIDYTESN
ncbi:Fic/DOC family N-terminal domain-containing protein [Aggregatibacter kilianii]|jgi:hypothetical protein|uniref:Fic/DOC family N-terminal domain-containing protein n=1 Tax=Aggregatibacter kilianii TaxID=2025884 RepID=UPI001EF8B081|nr:Fic/DOC family N-terminal domain-containing protein [Aggregatibacter kilianii]